jgi:phospholipase/lecithinase/hemolysin
MVDSLISMESAWVAYKESVAQARRATEEFNKIMEEQLLNFEYLEIGDGEI